MSLFSDVKETAMHTGYRLQDTHSALVSNKKPIIILGSVFVLIASALLLGFIAQRNLAPTDSDALFGGEVEVGYPSAGFVVSYSNERIKTCGFSVIGPNVAVTASHCVDDVQIMYLGKGNFNFNHNTQVRVINAQQKQPWVENKVREDDFAILNFVNGGYFSDFAEIGTPVEGCNYRVVAYGRTENPLESNTKPRKSGRMCANTVSGKVMYMTSDDQTSGICFGDSGSPVYYEGTNILVGVVASIIKNEDTSNSDPCQFGNTAIVVRADQNESVINQNIQAFDPNAEQITVNNDLAVTLANEQQLNPFTLDSVTRITRQLDLSWPVVLIGTSVLVLLFLAWLVLQQESSINAKRAKAAENGYIDATPIGGRF